jgi:hypothetical protein
MQPNIFATVTFKRTEDGGRKSATSSVFFSCPFLMDEKLNDCRLLLDGIGAVEPGQTVEVPIVFLNPSLLDGRLKVGRKFQLWEMRVIAEGEILKVLTATGSTPAE